MFAPLCRLRLPCLPLSLSAPSLFRGGVGESLRGSHAERYGSSGAFEIHGRLWGQRCFFFRFQWSRQHSCRPARSGEALRLRQSSAEITRKPARLLHQVEPPPRSLARSPSACECVRGPPLSRSLGHFSHQFMTAKQTICAKQNSIIKAFVVLVPSGLARGLTEGQEGRGLGAGTVGKALDFMGKTL